MPECRTVRHLVGPVQEYEQKCQCRNQSGTEIGVPVPDSHAGCRNADANGMGFDAVAQLWSHPNLIKDDLNLHLMVDD
jgi:hypothetical protein